MNQDKKNPLVKPMDNPKTNIVIKSKSLSNASSLSGAETLELLHDLEIKKVELELQNKELRLAMDKAESAAKKYADLFNEIFDFSPTGYFTIGPEGTIFTLNLRAALLLIKERSELVNSNFSSFINSETLPVFNTFLTKVFATRSRQTCDIRLNHKDNPSYYVHLEGKISEDEGKCLLTAVDITERLQSEETIHATASRLKRAELASKSGNWEIHPDTHVMIASEGARELYGVHKSHLNYDEVKHISLPEYRPMLDAAMLSLINDNKPYDLEFKIKALDTGIIKDIHSIAVFDAEKRIVFGVIQDISGRKRTEEALTESIKLYSTLFEKIPDGVYKSTHEGRFVDANPAMIKILGYENKEELLGMDINKDLYFSETERESMTLEAIENKLEVFRLKKKDGSEVWVEDNGWYTFNSSGQILFHEGVIRDVSARKRAEEEVIRLNSELEQRVLDRTSQLEAANKDIEAFSYSVSHDLRTPLRALDGFANILMEDYADVLDDEGKRMLKIIVSNANNMGLLIDELLSFSRLGRKEISHSKIDMRLMAESVFNELASEKDKERLIFFLHKLPEASGDPAMMRQIWVNLISNAIKFTSKKPDRSIEIGSIPGKTENTYYVKDNGAGFDMANSKNMFGVFKRLHSTKEFDGTGVGLAIVKRIIQRHKGSVRAEGVVHEGATIYFSIPARK